MLHKKTIDNLLDIEAIYLEPAVHNYTRGREVLTKYAGAKHIVVPSHWKIPELHGNEGSINDWTSIKKHVLVLGIKKSLTCRPLIQEARILLHLPILMDAQWPAVIAMCRAEKVSQIQLLFL